MVYLGSIYLMPAAMLLVNGVFLYAILLRSYVELTKEKKFDFYLGGAVFAMIIYVFTGNFLKGLLFWQPTTYLLMAFVFSQLGVLSDYLYKKYQKNM
jgi:hypothetical protein